MNGGRKSPCAKISGALPARSGGQDEAEDKPREDTASAISSAVPPSLAGQYRRVTATPALPRVRHNAPLSCSDQKAIASRACIGPAEETSHGAVQPRKLALKVQHPRDLL
jgi:hypothetical protein